MGSLVLMFMVVDQCGRSCLDTTDSVISVASLALMFLPVISVVNLVLILGLV